MPHSLTLFTVTQCKKLGVTRGEGSDIFKEMMSLTNALTPERYDTICESLKNGKFCTVENAVLC